MTQSIRRTPKNYDGTQVTTHRIKDLLPAVLTKISSAHKERPDLLLAAWPAIIGPQLAAMTQAVRFQDGILSVKVMNSPLLSLLSQHEKPRLLRILRAQFPRMEIKNIVFRIG